MKIHRILSFATTLCLTALFSTTGFSQAGGDKEKIKKTYEEKLKALSKDNWDGKTKLAKWCQENGLTAQAKALIGEVLKAKPDHEEARKIGGYVRFNEKWILESDLEKIRNAEREKEMKEKGYVKMKNGEWAPAADVPYLEKGLIKHNGLWVTKEDREKMDKGYVLVDGEWIAPEEAENVKKGLYKVAGKWVSLDEADAFHSNWETPWKLQTTHFNLVTSVNRAIAEQQKINIEDTYNRLYELFKFEIKDRPTIYLIATESDYKTFEGKNPSPHSSVYAGFIAMTNPERPGIAIWNKDYGRLYVSHAVAHVYVNRMAQGSKDVPEWFEEAIATYATRYYDTQMKDWSIANLKNKGDMSALKNFTEKMEISPDTFEESQKQLLEVGLFAWYCLNGGNEGLKKAFFEAAASLTTGKKDKIVKAVDAVLAKGADHEKELKALVK